MRRRIQCPKPNTFKVTVMDWALLATPLAGDLYGSYNRYPRRVLADSPIR